MAKITPKDIKTKFSALALAINGVNTFTMAKRDILSEKHNISYAWCLLLMPQRITPASGSDGLVKWSIEIWWINQDTQLDSKDLEDHWATLQAYSDIFIDSLQSNSNTYHIGSEIVNDYLEQQGQDRSAVVTTKFTMSTICS